MALEAAGATRADPAAWRWRLYWLLPVASSSLATVALLVGLFQAPSSSVDWEEATASSVSPEKGLMFTYQDRQNYRLLKAPLVAATLALDLLVLRGKWAQPTPPASMELAHAMLQVLRLVFAMAEAVLAVAFAGSVFVNPSYGMYAWGYPFAGLPIGLGMTDTVHAVLAVSAAAANAALSRGFARSPETLLQRALLGTLMVVSVWYPVYDSKHWFPACRLSNCWGEYMIIYAPLAAASEYLRKPQRRLDGVEGEVQSYGSISTGPPSAPSDGSGLVASPFELMLDKHQALLLGVSAVRLLVQFATARFCWSSPASYLKSGDLAPNLLAHKKFGEVWKNVVVWGLDLAGSVVLLIYAEAMAWRRRGKLQNPLQSESAGHPTTTSA